MVFRSLLLTGAIFISICTSAVEEVVMSRRTLDRSNLFMSGDFSFSVTTDDRSPSGWSAKVGRGSEERNVPIQRSGRTLVFLPGEILEVRNNRLPGHEHWSLMQETIGEFEVVRRTPSDFHPTGAMQAAEEKIDGLDTYVCQNGTLTLRMLPAFNGAIYSLFDAVSGLEFLYGKPEGAQSKLSFERLGFLEMVNRFGQTACVEFHPEWRTFPDGTAILTMEQVLPGGDVKLSRAMELTPGLPQVKLRSVFTPCNSVQNAFSLRHRPEATFAGSADNHSVSIFTQENGIWKEQPSPSGEVIPQGTRYALVDRDRGILFGVSYEVQDLQQLYLWNAENYVTLEAWSVARPLSTPLALAVRYFLIRGMSKINFLGMDGALFLPDLHPVLHAGKEWIPTLVYGSASCWKTLGIVFTVKDGQGKTVLSEKRPLSSPVPGFAVSHKCSPLDTRRLTPGIYKVEFSLSEGDIAGFLPLTVVSTEQLQEFQAFQTDIQNKIEEQRRACKNAPPAKKKQALRDFKQLLVLRNKYEEALQNGDMETLRRLSQALH